jgi:hypothetical protein
MNATNGATHDGDTTTFPNITAVKFDPLAAMQLWQQSAARFGRANEQLMHGLSAAAQMQVALCQELIQQQFSLMKNLGTGEKPATVLNGQIAKTGEEANHLLTSVRKISDEIRLSFTQATRILFEAEAPEVRESVAAAARKTDFSGTRKTAHAAESRA